MSGTYTVIKLYAQDEDDALEIAEGLLMEQDYGESDETGFEYWDEEFVKVVEEEHYTAALAEEDAEGREAVGRAILAESLGEKARLYTKAHQLLDRKDKFNSYYRYAYDYTEKQNYNEDFIASDDCVVYYVKVRRV